MAYSEKSKNSTIKYIKDKQREIKIRYRKEEFDIEIAPVIEKSGLSVAGFFKEAVAARLKAYYDARNKLLETLETVKAVTVREIPAIMQDDCRKIILYGSYARGDFTEDSDVDIAILTNCSREEAKKYDPGIDEVAAGLGIDTFAVVNYACLPLSEFEEKKEWYPFFMNIAKDGEVLYEQ